MERKTFLLFLLQLPFSNYFLKSFGFNSELKSYLKKLDEESDKMNDLNNWRPLTKSRFKTALECPTKLYYYKKEDEYANIASEDEFLQALAEGGYQVGELAKYYYPGGYDIKELGYKTPLEKTNELLIRDTVTIYEAAIKYANFFIRVDILNKLGNKIELIEVKAKSIDPNSESFTNKSGYISSKWKPYLYDVAFQTWVTKQAFPVTSPHCLDHYQS